MRKTLIAKVHIAKKDLALDEDTYRQALQGVTGKASCSKMSAQDLEKVLGHFKAQGWKPAKATSRRYSPKTRDASGHDLVDKIRAVWIDMYKAGVIDNGTEAALDAWVKRTTSRINKGLGVERTDWLRARKHQQMATQVLEGLKQWQKRVALAWQNEDLKTIAEEQRRTDQAQAKVVIQLLEGHAIFWWPVFKGLDIDDSHTYCKNRRRLNHG